MNYNIKASELFAKLLKRLGKKYHSIKQDYARLIEELHANPTAGVSLGGGVRKVRMAIGSKNRGKSHGARIITYTYIINETEGVINLIYIYDKEEQESISAEEIERLVKEIDDNPFG